MDQDKPHHKSDPVVFSPLNYAVTSQTGTYAGEGNMMSWRTLASALLQSALPALLQAVGNMALQRAEHLLAERQLAEEIAAEEQARLSGL